MSSRRLGALAAPWAAAALLALIGATEALATSQNARPEGALDVTTVFEGMPPSNTVLRASVACSRDGQRVVERELRFRGDAATVREIEHIPLPSHCRITASDGAGATLIEYSHDGRSSLEPARVQLNPGHRRVQVTITYSFPSSAAVGSLAVTKVVVGTAPSSAPFVVRVVCSGGFEHTIRFTAQGGTEIVPIPLDPNGITCKLRETRRNGADAVQFAPARTGIALSVEAPTFDVTVKNIFSTG